MDDPAPRPARPSAANETSGARKPTPTVDVLKELLLIFTVEQLAQFARLALAAQECSAAGLHADVRVRFINALPRYMGTESWEATRKP